MKYFLIGIDGCQKEHFYRFEMPFMQRKLSEGQAVDLQENLISRGWAEICTGLHAVDSGAYYERAVMNGTHDWTTSYNMLAEKKNNPSIPLLWALLNAHDYSVGVMNVPTSNPAPEVNGFFVSGGGGGKDVADEVDINQCYPKSIKATLDGLGYIADERVSSLLFQKKLYNETDFFARLKLMTEKRVESYLALNNKFNVDFGFIVFRSVVVVENIVSGEVERYLEGDKNVNENLINAIKDFYRHLDSCLEKLCSGLGVEKIGFVSDHGTVPQKYSVNLNAFLRRSGFQQGVNKKTGFMLLLKKYKHLLPYALRTKLKKNRTITAQYAGISSYDRKKSLAFNNCMGSAFFGIYVNDINRFGGRVKEEDILSVATKIVDAFNVDAEAKKYGFSAVCQIGKYTGKYAQYWPDILVRTTDGYSPSDEQNSFVAAVSRSQEPVYLKELKHDFWSGTKGAIPLSSFVGHQSLNADEYNGQDLTAVFNIVKKEFGI